MWQQGSKEVLKLNLVFPSSEYSHGTAAWVFGIVEVVMNPLIYFSSTRPTHKYQLTDPNNI